MEEKESSISYAHMHGQQTSPSPSNHSNYSIPNNQTKIIVQIGKFQQPYYLNDLQLLSYFEALFSSRWKYNFDIDTQQNDDNTIVIGDNKSLQFGIDELNTIIHIKKYNRIPPSYNYKKLAVLCNAADFFSEDILNEELFILFFKKCKPSISFRALNELTKLNHNFINNGNTKLISQSATKYLRGIHQNITNMKQKWLEKYKTLPIEKISYDNDMISQS